MGKSGVEQWLYLLDEAFEGNEEHSLLGNLRTVTPDDPSTELRAGWLWLPPGGGRSIFDLVRHVGECKYVYENHAFGDGSMRWDRPGTVPSVERDTPLQSVIGWLREGQRRLRDEIVALADDADLLQHRRANWGETYETRWLISVMIQHDLYHAGEINHIRALRQGNDRWPWGQG